MLRFLFLKKKHWKIFSKMLYLEAYVSIDFYDLMTAH